MGTTTRPARRRAASKPSRNGHVAKGEKAVTPSPFQTEGNGQASPQRQEQAGTASTPASGAAPAGKNGHGADGRFVAGNACAKGHGNPIFRKLARNRSVLMEAVSDDDLRDIIGAMVRAAKGGDVQAAQVVLDRVVGKPTPAVRNDEADLDEWELLRRLPRVWEALLLSTGSVRADWATYFVQLQQQKDKALTEMHSDPVKYLVSLLLQREGYNVMFRGEDGGAVGVHKAATGQQEAKPAESDQSQQEEAFTQLLARLMASKDASGTAPGEKT